MGSELIISIIGTAILTLSASYLGHKMTLSRLKIQLEMENKYKEKREFKEKLEELYLLIDGWSISFGTMYIPLISVMKNEITYDEALNIFIKNQSESNINYRKIEMLINMYFIELKSSYDTLLEKKDDISKIIDLHKKEYENDSADGIIFLKPFIQAQSEFYQGINDFKEKISSFSKKIVKSF